MNWSFLKFGVKFIYLIENITVAILLQITELLMEPVYTCECNEFRVSFVVMYFLIPAFAFSAFACSLRRGNILLDICKGCRDKWKNSQCMCPTDCNRMCLSSCFLSFCKTLYPAICWGVILLIDGKYVACALYSKCNSTMTTVDRKDPEMVRGMMLSKVCGLIAVVVFLLFYFIYLIWNCCRSSETRYKEMCMSQLEEDREEFARKYAKNCSERRRARCEEELKKAESQSGAGNSTSPEAVNPPTFDAEKIVEIIQKGFASPFKKK